jgi:hypothetical protein
MKLKTNSGNFQPCPEYTGSAVCVDVTPLKTVQTSFGPKEKFRFVFEIGELKPDGTPWCVWSAPFTVSYHENSALRPFLKKWMGRELTGAEQEAFDTEHMLGRTAQVTIIHEHRDGEVYANIALIQPDKSAEPLKASGKFVRIKDRPPKDGQAAPAGQGSYRRAEQRPGGTAEDGGPTTDLLATKIHVGKCKGLEVRDLSPEQVEALVQRWLPTAKSNAKPTADDRRLIAALDFWQESRPGTGQGEDEMPF